MKIVITGSLGHISLPLTKELLQKGHTVTVISSNPEKQKDIEALGAAAAIGSLEDADFLTATFTGADAAYCMIPPNNYFDPGFDLAAYVLRLGNNYAKAIQQSGVKRVIHLSSIGGDMEKGSGLILVHHQVENILAKVPDLNLSTMRPTAFYYNLLGFLEVIKKMGAIVSNYGEEDLLPWVSPKDIAAAVADEIATPLVGRKIRYVASEELTCSEIARILGTAIGKPDLKWVVIPDEQMLRNLESAGMPPAIAAGFVEMNSAIHSGALSKDYFRHRPAVMGKVKMTEFAKEFAAAFNQK